MITLRNRILMCADLGEMMLAITNRWFYGPEELRDWNEDLLLKIALQDCANITWDPTDCHLITVSKLLQFIQGPGLLAG
jgi:hypothetical protein